jgi:putative (di)nucleoside polyphosphate hydrolase
MTPTLPYRSNVCMFVINNENLLFIGERAGSPGVWQLPQGGEEEGLTREENVIKELTEELGALPQHFSIMQQLKATHCYDFRNPPAYAVGKFRGQQQSFWLVRFTGTDNDIQLDRYHPEFSAYKWIPLKELLDHADPVRIAGYEAALKEVVQRFPANVQNT